LFIQRFIVNLATSLWIFTELFLGFKSVAITRNRGAGSSTGIVDEEIIVPPVQVNNRRTASTGGAPDLREGSPEMLVNILVEKYFISEEVAARFQSVGVAIFIRLSEDFITGVVMENGGTLFNAALVTAAKEDMVSRLEVRANADINL
jgi:hypothetical protein